MTPEKVEHVGGAREMASLLLDEAWRMSRVLCPPGATRAVIAMQAERLLALAGERLSATRDA